MAVLSGLKPKKVFEFFEKICEIPHGSGNTKGISDYLVSFAEERGLWVYRDEINNVLIKKEPSAGYENEEAVILQGHTDMVCEKSPDAEIDMEKEGLLLRTDGEKVYAEGTTLGADDGIAVAMMLAVLDDKSLCHPPIEAVFTADEEIGLIGAGAFDTSLLKGKRMINIDSEEEGVFTVGCAGGETAKCYLTGKKEAFAGQGTIVSVRGLLGGHSGVEIDKGRANSNILLGRVLDEIGKKTPMRIATVTGGFKDNAIPRESTAKITVSDIDEAREACLCAEKAFKNEYALTDGNICVEISSAENELAFDLEGTQKIITLLCCLPNGIIEMSKGIEGLVQTSLNFGILKTEDNTVMAGFGVRSSFESQKDMLLARLKRLTEALGGRFESFGRYSGWEYRTVSPLRDLMEEVYTEQYGKKPEIKAIHAGLECGAFAGKINDFDGVSVGPDISQIHTFSETLYVASTERVYKMIIETLKKMKR